jgi:hypothetical protein
MAAAGPKEVPRDRSPNYGLERYAETLEEKHGLPMH